MKVRLVVPALTFTVALAGHSVLAQSHHGGGSRGGQGGGSSSGSAVARGSGSGAAGAAHYGSRPAYASRGGGAEQRHPRAGTGHGYAYGGYGHGGYSYGHGHGYGYGYGYYPGHGYYNGGSRYYRPYYGYRPYYSYYPYSPYYWPGVSLSLGWGYASSEPYYSGGYESPAYSARAYAPNVAEDADDGGYDGGAPPAREAGRSSEGHSGRVRLEVRPEDTSVYVDDAFHGTAREARIMNLPPGRHRIELVRPGFATEHREVTVVTGESQDVLVELLRH